MSPTPSFFHPNYSPPTKKFTEGSFFKEGGLSRAAKVESGDDTFLLLISRVFNRF